MERQTPTKPRPLSLWTAGTFRMIAWSLPAGSRRDVERRARLLLRDVLQRAGLGHDDILDAETIAAELAVNAVQHGVPPYELRIFYPGGSLPVWCEVVDSGPITDAFSRCLGLDTNNDAELRESGRGLRMVGGLSDGHFAVYLTAASRNPAKAVGFALPCRRSVK